MVGLPVLVTIVVALVAGPVSAALAGWSSGVVVGGGTVRTGDLQVTTGAMTWHQVTPGVGEPASGDLTSTPADFVSMPGDVVEIRMPVTTFLQGDNMVANLTVACDDVTTDAAVEMSVHVEDAAGHQVATAPGTSATVTALTGHSAGVSAQWTVIVEVQVRGEHRWATPYTSTEAVGWSVGAVRATLDQVRQGGGA